MSRQVSLSTEQALLNAILRHDLGAFVAKVFQTVSPGDLYLHNWHIDAIVYALMRVLRKKERRLLITLPPRHLKSICASVAFIAFALGHDPSRKFACVSHSLDVAETFARQFRAVVSSDWYRVLFPNVRFIKNTEAECVTDKGGGRFVVPVGGGFTGRGGSTIVIDDPLEASDAQSDKLRRAVNEWYATTLLTRLDDKASGSIILIAQRLHEDDLPAKVLSEGGWHHLDLPAIAQEDQEVAIGPGSIHRRAKGDVLHPAREPLAVLEDTKHRMGSVKFSALYLQRPVPLEGNLIRRAWIKWYDGARKCDAGGRIAQSWDVASTASETADCSVCTTWLMQRRNYFLLDVFRDRLEFPGVKHKVIELARAYRPDTILIEQTGPGLHLVQEFRTDPIAGVPVPIGIKPEGDKRDRMAAQSARFEAGQVHFPSEAPWLSTLLHELLGFPNARHDDQIDSVSQFLRWAEMAHRAHDTPLVSAPRFYVDGRWITYSLGEGDPD